MLNYDGCMSNASTQEQWVGVPAVAEHLGMTIQWVTDHAPAMPHVRPGREYRFKLSRVETWFEQWAGGQGA